MEREDRDAANAQQVHMRTRSYNDRNFKSTTLERGLSLPKTRFEHSDGVVRLHYDRER
jgi:hypothetical protein